MAEVFGWYEARSAGLGHEFLRAVSVAFASIERGPEQQSFAIDDVRMLPPVAFRTLCTMSARLEVSRLLR
jgi:hypothetical protein